jgi:hypothetical protein
MKYKILLIFYCSLSSIASAQKIINIEDDNLGIERNVYYKDVNNILNNFEGTWTLNNADTIFTIKLIKVTKFYSPENDNYTDYIIGEYKYSLANHTIINTLNTLVNPPKSLFDNGIDGNLILFKPNDLNQFKTVLFVQVTDPQRKYIEATGRLTLDNRTPNIN